MKRPLVILAFWLLLSSILRSISFPQYSDLHFERIGLEQGLSQSMVFCITQDRQGYMWFGTEDGLNKYDGYEFTVFRHHDEDTNSLSSSNIRCLAVDTSGTLWIGTWDAGLNRYDPVNDRFVRYLHDPSNPRSLSNDKVVSILPDSGGILWVSTWGGGLNMFDAQSGTFEHFRHLRDDSTSLSTDALYTLFDDRKGSIWIGSFLGGLNRFDRTSKTFSRFMNRPGDPRSLSDNRVTAMTTDSTGTLWIGTWGGGLNALTASGGAFASYRFTPARQGSISSDIILSMCIVGRELWLGTLGGGLSILDFTSGGFHAVRNHPYKSVTLSEDRVFSLFRDRAGLLWIGTGNGICTYDKRKQQFGHRSHDPLDPGSLSGNEVFPILEDSRGDVWIGTYGSGLNRFDRSSGTFTHLRHKASNPASLSNDRIYALFEDWSGILWIGTDGGGIDRYDGISFRRVLHDPRNPASISSNYIQCITGDSARRIWIGTQADGVNCLDPRTGDFTRYRHDPHDTASLIHDEIQCITVDHSGAIWIGTAKGGLNRFDTQTNKFTRFDALQRGTDNPSVHFAQAIHEDRNGVLWIGTMGGGLIRFDWRRNIRTVFQEQDGLPSEIIYGILEDSQGSMWLSTNNGISRFLPSTGGFQNFSISHGLQSNEFNFNSFHKGRSGILYFGGINGYNEFRPESIESNTITPPVVITSFRIFDRTVPLEQLLSNNRKLVINYNENHFSFEFSALDYSASQKNLYSYMMEGWEETWVRPTRRRQATYTNLDPGEYVFRLRGSNGDGVWNLSGIAVPVVILPPFWQTWWFRLLAAGIVALALYYVHGVRVAKALELEKMRVRIASDLHDDIGSTLTRIVVQSERILGSDQIEKMKALAQQIGVSSREVVATLSDVVWSIDVRNDTVGNLLDRMRDFAADILTPRLINFQFDARGMDSTKRLPVDLRQNVYLIYKEAINNIAKHSYARNVSAVCENTGGQFSLKIADDGRGMPPHETGHGHGLRNMRMRAERIGARMEIINNNGVTVHLTMGEF